MDSPGFDVSALRAPPSLNGLKRVLCIQPHPDDNEIGMGGTIAWLASQGCEIHYLTVTNGDKGGPTPDMPVEQVAKIRHEETIAAGTLLGATDFIFLPHGDGTLSDPLGLSDEIADVIRKVQPEAIFCPDPWLSYEGHLDHITTGRAAASAFHVSGQAQGQGDPWRAQAIGFYFTSKPNTIVDITAFFDRKFQAINLHASQMTPEYSAMLRVYFQMKGTQLAQGKSFALGEGLKVLSQLHMHCFVDAETL
jgi:LmbE family N-acetylglucosaminyl deacetylase